MSLHLRQPLAVAALVGASLFLAPAANAAPFDKAPEPQVSASVTSEKHAHARRCRRGFRAYSTRGRRTVCRRVVRRSRPVYRVAPATRPATQPQPAAPAPAPAAPAVAPAPVAAWAYTVVSCFRRDNYYQVDIRQSGYTHFRLHEYLLRDGFRSEDPSLSVGWFSVELIPQLAASAFPHGQSFHSKAILVEMARADGVIEAHWAQVLSPRGQLEGAIAC